MRFAITAAIVVSLTACAASKPTKLVWNKTRDNAMALDEAQAKCDYETSAATQTATPGLKTSFGQELDKVMRKNDLTVKCMAAQGWVSSRE